MFLYYKKTVSALEHRWPITTSSCIALFSRNTVGIMKRIWVVYILNFIPTERHSMEMLHLFQAPCYHDIWGNTAGWTHDPRFLSFCDESCDACQLWRGLSCQNDYNPCQSPPFKIFHGCTCLCHSYANACLNTCGILAEHFNMVISVWEILSDFFFSFPVFT